MRLIYAFLMLCVVSIASCSKDKFNSKPSLKLKSVSGNYVPYDPNVDYSLQFVLEYTDAEGDIAGLPVFVEKFSSSYPCLNGSLDPTFLDSSTYLIPKDVPQTSNQKGEIVLTFNRSQDLRPVACSPLDTLEDATFKFWLKDAAGNISDTVTSPIIKIGKYF